MRTMSKLARKIIAGAAAIVTGIAMITLMLAMNDWGKSTPSDIQQIGWAFVLTLWPCIIGFILWPKRDWYE